MCGCSVSVNLKRPINTRRSFYTQIFELKIPRLLNHVICRCVVILRKQSIIRWLFYLSNVPRSIDRKEVMPMDPSTNWTQIAVTLIKSIFDYLSRKDQSRRDNGDSG